MYSAIILSRIDIREHDQRIAFYTRERGLVIAYATGVKKITSKQSPRLLPGTLVYVELVERHGRYKFITSETIRLYPCIRKSLIKNAVVQQMLGLIFDTLRPDEPDAALFRFLTRMLAVFEEKDEEDIPLLYVFALWRLMALFGYNSKHKITTDIPRELAAWHAEAEYHLERAITVPLYLFDTVHVSH